MTYIAGGLGSLPRLVCDGCGAVNQVPDDRMPTWLISNRPPPGWTLTRTEGPDGVVRHDRCPKCSMWATK